jgi:peptide deformylase
MAVRKVISMGHPVLRQVAAPVPEKEISSPKIQTLIQDMVETMIEYDGRGLAAPQVSESLRIVVMIWDFDPKEEPYLRVLINPELKVITKDKSTFWEGCLSVPGLRGKVSRPNKLQVKALNAKREKVEFVAEGFAATVVQHECDHLDGVLYVDHIEDLKSGFAFNREYSRYLASEETPDDGEGGDE